MARSSSLVSALGFASSLALAGCDGDLDLDEAPSAEADPGADEPAPSLGPAPSAVTWSLAWALGEDELGPRDEAEPLAATTDLGLEVWIDAGWIGSWGVTLIPCADASTGATAELAVAAPAQRAAAAPSPTLAVARRQQAAAGHTSGDDDPSAWVAAEVESLTAGQRTQAEPRALAGARYCEAHYLIAPITDASEGFAAAEAALQAVDPSASLIGASVVILGRWRSGAGEPVPFVVRSELGYGKILPLELDAELAALDEVEIEVALIRDLARSLDGVDFEADPDEDIAWTVLGNLAKHSRALARR